jgi:cell division protein FtsB
MQALLRKIALFVGLLGLAFALFLPGYMQIKHLREKNLDLAQKNKRLESENGLLQKQLQLIDKDKLYQEKILREKLGVVRKDEIPVKMIPTD